MAGHTLSYIATLNSSGFMTGLNQMLSGLGGFSGSLNGLKSTLSGLTPLLTNPFVLGATAVAGIGVAIGKAVGNFASFDDQMRKVAAVTRTAMEDMGSLTDKARELGATTKFTGEEVGQGMQYLGMAGFSKEEIEGSIGATLNLAQATESGLGETADIMSNIMSTFKMGAEDSGHAADVLALTTASANTDLQQLGDSMKYVGPVAQSMGMSFEEAAAATGFLSNVGIQASMAGTTLRGALSRLNDAAPKEVFDTLDKYGLSMEQVSAESHDFTDILQTLHDAGMSTGDMLKLMGLRAGPGMLELISQGKDPLNEYIKSLENADGTAQQMADTMEGGLGGAFRSFKSRISSLSQGQFISDVANNIVAPLIRGVTSGIGTIQNLFGNIYKGVKTSDLAASIGKMFSGVSKYISASTGNLSKLFDPIKQSIEKVFGEGAIGKGIGALFNHLTDSAEIAFESIGKGFELLASGAEALGPVFETVGNGIGEAVEWAGALSKTIKEYSSGSSTIQKIGDAFEKLKSPIETVKTAWEGFTNAMPTAISSAVDAIQILFQKLFDWLDEKLNIGDTIKDKLGIGEGGFIDSLLKNKEEIENAGKDVGQEFTEEALAQTDGLTPGIEEDLMDTDAAGAGSSKGAEFVENFEASLSAMELADYYSDVGGQSVMGDWNVGSEIGDTGYSMTYRKKNVSESNKNRIGVADTSGNILSFESWEAANNYVKEHIGFTDELIELQMELSAEEAGVAAGKAGYTAERIADLQTEIDELIKYREAFENAFNEGIILDFDKAWKDFSEDAANVFSDNLVSGVEASNMIEQLTTLKSTDKDAFEKMEGEAAIEWWNGLESLIKERSETLAIDPNADVSKMDEQIREYLKNNPYTVELTGEITDIFGNVEPEQLMFNFAENWEDNVKKIKEDVTDWNLFRENVALPALKQSLEYEKKLLSTASDENYKVVNEYVDDLVKLYGEMPEAFGKAEVELINSLSSAYNRGAPAKELIGLIDEYTELSNKTDKVTKSTNKMYDAYANLETCLATTWSAWQDANRGDLFAEPFYGSKGDYIKNITEKLINGEWVHPAQISMVANIKAEANSNEQLAKDLGVIETVADIDGDPTKVNEDVENLITSVETAVPEMTIGAFAGPAYDTLGWLVDSIWNTYAEITIGANTSALPTGTIPAYAEGGYVDSPTLALVGEAGPEWIVNEKQMNELKQQLDDISDKQNYISKFDEFSTLDAIEYMKYIHDSKLPPNPYSIQGTKSIYDYYNLKYDMYDVPDYHFTNDGKIYSNPAFMKSGRPWSDVVKTILGGIGIPAYAEGGYVESPTLALVGEAGPEWVVNENQMEELLNNSEKLESNPTKVNTLTVNELFDSFFNKYKDKILASYDMRDYDIQGNLDEQVEYINHAYSMLKNKLNNVNEINNLAAPIEAKLSELNSVLDAVTSTMTPFEYAQKTAEKREKDYEQMVGWLDYVSWSGMATENNMMPQNMAPDVLQEAYLTVIPTLNENEVNNVNAQLEMWDVEIPSIVDISETSLTDTENAISDTNPIMPIELDRDSTLLDANLIAGDISKIRPTMIVDVNVSANADQINEMAKTAVRKALADAYE